MARSITWAVCILLAPAAASARADDARAREVLEAAKKAATALESISYEASYLGVGALSRSLPVLDGSVTASKTGKLLRLRIEGQRTLPRAQDATAFCFVTDGRTAALTDDMRRMHQTGPDSAARAQEERIRLFPAYFLVDDAFDAELKAVKHEHTGEETVAGVRCDVISVTYDRGGQRTATLYIGADDHLVRRVVWPRGSAGRLAKEQNTAEIFTARSIVADAPVVDALFQLSRPVGYRQQVFVDPTRRASGGMLAPGTDAPDWSLPNEAGEPVSLKSLRGQVVIVDFWASWCGPCKMAMPHLQSLHDKYKDKPVKVFSVNCRERGGDAAARSFLKQKKFTYPQLFKGDAAANDYLVRGIPTMYVIGTDGKILHGERGFRQDLVESLSRIIDSHLDKTARKDDTARPVAGAAQAG